MPLFIQVFTVSFLLCFVTAGVFAEATLDLELQRSLDQASSYKNRMSQRDNDEDAYVNGDLLERLQARPSKRQWCRKGMTYNHVLGSCTLSFAAIRGKGRRH